MSQQIESPLSTSSVLEDKAMSEPNQLYHSMSDIAEKSPLLRVVPNETTYHNDLEMLVYIAILVLTLRSI